MTDFVSFHVVGHPEPAGSKRAVPTRTDWRFTPGVRWKVLDDNKNAAGWKKVVAMTAKGAMLKDRRQPFEGPVWVQMIFFRQRPISHLRKGGELSAEGSRKEYPTSKPDLLKLARAVEDAMTGIVYVDDAQIVSETMRKQWGPESVQVTVMPL